MDEKSIELNRNHGSASNVLCVDGTLEDAMQLYDQREVYQGPDGDFTTQHQEQENAFYQSKSEYKIH